ncbi:xanthine and Co dehydrogenase maturation factor [Oleiphilus messinensis]|uniref:Xanthine and Co dehydrogenase maturation factor n=1 Tax=Oleiphilus messinensis TaxID=141451 RepID=A0A1Y0IB78_9GAMM|nr:xanthine dehydrogenase accessory protein XdhC [Oleiphilus messinensis]ARU57731.1 xanthine and Co dehydrogenase maturation factor [Oleiphilus messinensis]
MNNLNWISALQACQQRGEAHALVTILGCSGSTPRDQSSKMVVTADQTYDTIGGGNLEFTITNKARELLAQHHEGQEIYPMPLGGALGQCCGGNVTVLVETFAACQFRVALVGAGHVAQELIKILGALPCRVTWIDSRGELFPDQIPPNTRIQVTATPVTCIPSLPAGSDLLILTHNHQLDYELTEAALKHGALRHIGLIGSQTKANRFQHRLRAAGFTTEQISAVQCPVGLAEVPGKLPMEVAVSIAGELIALEHRDKTAPVHRGIPWREIKRQLQPGDPEKLEPTQPHLRLRSARPEQES